MSCQVGHVKDNLLVFLWDYLFRCSKDLRTDQGSVWLGSVKVFMKIFRPFDH